MPSQDPIVFLHGFTGRASDWDRIAPESNAFQLDLPGHGRHVGVPDDMYTFSGFRNWLYNWVRSLESKIILVGYSMGGRIALDFAATFPELISGLGLISAGIGLDSYDDRKARLESDKKWADMLRGGPLSDFLIAWYNQPVLSSIKYQLDFDQLCAIKLQNDPDELAKALLGFSVGIQVPRRSFLARPLPFQVLYLAGQDDSKYDQLGRSLADLNAGILYEQIQNAGHNVVWENSVGVAKEISGMRSWR